MKTSPTLFVENCLSNLEGYKIDLIITNKRTRLQKYPPKTTELMQAAFSLVMKERKMNLLENGNNIDYELRRLENTAIMVIQMDLIVAWALGSTFIWGWSWTLFEKSARR